jgi:hypothetical protein
MAYNINLSKGDLLTVVEDGTADISSASVALVGKNFPGYGEYINENFVHMVENFAGTSPPANQLTGQLWFDTVNNILKVWDSTAWISAGKGNMLNDVTSTTPHYLTFVNSASGSPDFKVSSNKGIVYTPSTGNFGLGVSTALSKFVVNTNVSTSVANASPNSGVNVHVHGGNGLAQGILFDAYGGSVAVGDYATTNASSLILRRSNGLASAPQTVKVNDIIGTLGGQGYNGVAYSTNRVSISYVATENWTTTANGTKIEFRTTAASASSPSIALTIQSNGDLVTPGNFTSATVTASNVTATVANITTITSTTVNAGTVTASAVNATTVSGTLQTASQTNITNVGTLIGLNVSGSATISGTMTVTGFIKSAADITAYYTSDSRLKTKIEKIDNALAKTLSLDGVTFNWNDLAIGKDTTERESGVLAQQVILALPEAVAERENGYLAVRYEKLVPLLIEAIKELKAEVDALKKSA